MIAGSCRFQNMIRGLLVLITLVGCQASRIMYPPKEVVDRISITRENLQKLEVCQTGNDVLAIMGPPYETRRYKRYAEHLEYWLYLTESMGVLDPAYNDASYTFLAFDGNILQAWGKAHEVIPFLKDHVLLGDGRCLVP